MNLKEILEQGIKETKGNKRAQQLFNEMYSAAIIDPLTKAFTRRHLDEMPEGERRKKCENGLGLIMLDIDNFHDYNEKYGHLQGNSALAKVVGCIYPQIREGDGVCRYGGDEFLVLCYGADLEETREIAERIREYVELVEIPLDYPLIEEGYQKITITAGVSVMHRGQYDKIEKIVHEADRRLLEGKRKGKNKVYI